MALQIRRGTDAERLTITPAEGELIYTTDTKLIYVGDGSTLGGTKADSGITDLLSDTSPQLGGNLDLNSQTITGTGAISIVGNISGNTVAGSSGNFTSSVIGSLQASSVQGDLTGSVFADDSTMLVDGTDGKIVLSNNVIQDLSNVYVPTTPTGGDALVWNAVDSRWEAGNPAVAGGTFVGDVKGSIFLDDSSLFFDAINDEAIVNQFNTAIIKPLDAGLGVKVTSFLQNVSTVFGLETVDASGIFRQRLLDTTGNIDGTGAWEYDPITGVPSYNGTDGTIGGMYFVTEEYITGNYSKTHSYLQGDISQVLLGHTDSGIVSRADSLCVANGRVTIGDISPSAKLSVDGDAVFVGTVTAGQDLRVTNALTIVSTIENDDSSTIYNAATRELFANKVTGDLVGSVFADDSSAIIDGTDGTITAGGFVQFGSYNTTERNALTAANGMVIYNSQVNRFQGYQNGAWINIDDGTAA
jgi:hypothetical protein